MSSLARFLLVSLSIAMMCIEPVVPSEDTQKENSQCVLQAVATAVSSDFVDGLQNLIGSIHAFEAGLATIVYDLGMSSEELATVQTWQNAQVFRFPFQDFPPHVRELSNFAWKACVIKLAVEKLGCVLYLDAGMELRRPLGDVRNDLQRHGQWFVAANMGQYIADLKIVMPGQISALGMSEAYRERMSLAAGMQGWCQNHSAWTAVFMPWWACSLRHECISPPGSNTDNHRFDQSALSLVVHAANDFRAAQGQAPFFIQQSLRSWFSKTMLQAKDAQRLESHRVSLEGLFFYARRRHYPKPFAQFVRIAQPTCDFSGSG